MTSSTISVITPCYNRERFIGASIESVLGQTFRDFELIVVDDGSTDRSLEIIRSYKDLRIRVISQTNQGACIAQNVGIEAARGKWLRILDSDDLLQPGCLEGQLRDISSCPPRSIVAGMAVSVNENNELLPLDWYNLKHSRPSGSQIPLSVFFPTCGSGQLYLYPREALLEIGGFNPELRVSYDYNLTLRLHEHGYRFYQFDTPVLRARHHGGERLTLVRNSEADLRMHLDAFRGHYRALFGGRPPIGDEEARRAFGRHLWGMGRDANRHGQMSVAKDFYALAMEVAGTNAWVGSKFTRALYRFMPPTMAEQIVESVKVLSGRVPLMNPLRRSAQRS